MKLLNDNSIVKEIESVVENYVVMLNLAYDSIFSIKLKKNKFKNIHTFDYEIIVKQENSNIYVMKMFIYEDDTLSITLDTDRFYKVSYFYKYLKSFNTRLYSGLANPDKEYLKIECKNLEDLKEAVDVIARYDY